jgi:predicted glycoside hydrolase/deacetylase ChbG (UPF0249 family)
MMTFRTIAIAVFSPFVLLTCRAAVQAAEDKPGATSKTSQTTKDADQPAAKAEGKRYVIIHADDAGMSHSVNQATIDAMRDGIVSSASIMVPCPWFPEFAELVKKHPEGDFGVHLTLTSEWKGYRWGPVASRDKVPSLLDKDGYLPGSADAVKANAKASEVEIELRAQIERAKQFGVPVTHLDPHMGAALKRIDLLEIYVKLALEYDVPVLFSEFFTLAAKREYPGLEGDVANMSAALRAQKLPVLDGIFQYYEGDDYDQRKQTYLNVLRKLKPGVTEIIIHCGYDGTELRRITSSNFIRDSDRRIFCDKEVIDEVKKLGIEVITWKKFRELTRAQSTEKSTKLE